jgi:hypothetical protein
MTRLALSLTLLGLLAACGVDGAPTRPDRAAWSPVSTAR